MTTVYCKRNQSRRLDFYISDNDREYYLFSQRPYRGVEDYYRKGVSLNNAINHSKGKSNHMIHKVMDKLPIYIRYIEKEHGIAVFEQNKRKLAEAVQRRGQTMNQDEMLKKIYEAEYYGEISYEQGLWLASMCRSGIDVTLGLKGRIDTMDRARKLIYYIPDNDEAGIDRLIAESKLEEDERRNLL